MSESFDNEYFDEGHEQNGEVQCVISCKPKNERTLRNKQKKRPSKKIVYSDENWEKWEGEEDEEDEEDKEVEGMDEEVGQSLRNKKSDNMGRKFNSDAQKEHIAESKKYNEIIYHFVRMNLFVYQKFKVAQKCEEINLFQYLKGFKLSASDRSLVKKCKELMNTDVFPKFEEEKKISFLLHPKSLHFVLSELKKDRNSFTSQQIKLMLLTYFSEKKLLSSELGQYIDSFWKDIVKLAAKEESRQEMNPENFAHQLYENNVLAGTLTTLSNRRKETQPKNTRKNTTTKTKQIQKANHKTQRRKTQNKTSQKEQLQNELEEDQTIIAYEIACYIHYIFKLYDLKWVQK